MAQRGESTGSGSFLERDRLDAKAREIKDVLRRTPRTRLPRRCKTVAVMRRPAFSRPDGRLTTNSPGTRFTGAGDFMQCSTSTTAKRRDVIARVFGQNGVAYSNRRICFSTGAVHGSCYASPIASGDVWIRVPTGSHSKKGGPGFAGQVLEFSCLRADLWIRGPTTVTQQEGGLGFRCQVLEIWRARQDFNPRPPGS
jgi:hypothetical protein